MNKNKFVFLFIGFILFFIAVTNFMHMRLARSGMMFGNKISQHPQRDITPSTIFVNAEASELLTKYISSHNLSCMQCHEINANKVGPAYVVVSQKYASQPDAIKLIQSHIANGYGAMPGGLANKEESYDLAKITLQLTNKFGK